jgi:hypothetical protein
VDVDGDDDGDGVRVRDVVDVGRDVDVVVDEVVVPPGSVVIATEPSVVLTHATAPRKVSTTATIRKGMPIAQP